ncbi:MAG: CARDB domain-containing protein, partial [Cyanobium sp.]
MDLVLTAASVPDSATVGQPLTVTWTVQNSGDSTALGGWEDAVYLSEDPVYDGRDLELALVWRGDLLHAGESYTRSATASLLSTGKPGLNYLIFRTNSLFDQAESSLANNELAVAIELDLNGPDIKASAMSAPVMVGLGSSFDLSYRVDNVGASAAQLPWTESIYISTDDLFDLDDRLLIERNVEAGLPLPPGLFRLQNERLTIPTGYGSGANYLILRVNDDRRLGENDLSNNTLATPLTLGSTGPDLTVASASAPDVVPLGSWVDVHWTVVNGGDAAAEATWEDQLWLSEDSVFGPGDRYLGEFDGSLAAPLAAGESYTSNQSIRLPSSAKAGRNYLLIRTNAGWQSSQGETNLANNEFVLPIELSLDGPDLAVTAAESPTSGSVGRSIVLSWSVTNMGSQAATGQWIDTIYLSDDEIYSNEDLFLANESLALPASLAVGESYQRSRTVSVPRLSSGGRKYLLFQTNIYPDSEQGEVSLANNQVAVPIDLDLQAPDLVLLSASAPITAVAGARLDLSWQVKNEGLSAAEGSWYDQVYLSRDPYYDYTDTYLGSSDPTAHLPLAVGDSYSQSLNVSLPGSGFAGISYLIVRANPYGHPAELDGSNNECVVSIDIDPNGPDLQPVSLQAPSQARVGSLLNLAWTVTNRGAAAANQQWLDQLYLSADTELDPSDVVVASYSRFAAPPLAAGESYTYSQTISLPKGKFSGPGHLLLATNPWNQQPETDAANNRLVVPITIDAAGPDLVMESALAPLSASVGGLVQLSWKVVNAGLAPAEANWMDDVYLSEDDKLDSIDHYLVAERIDEQTPLAAGDHYVMGRSVVIPRVATAGPKYLLFRANSYLDQGETSLANNLLAKPIMIDFNTPDLQVLF